MVALGVAQALVDRARGVADLQAQVPQQVEHELDDLLAARRLLVGQQEQQIDVGERRQLAAAVAADRDDAQLLGRAGVGGGIDALVGEVEDHPDQLVHQEGGRGQHRRRRCAAGPAPRSGGGSRPGRRPARRAAAPAPPGAAARRRSAGPRPAWPRPPPARGGGRWRGGRGSGRRAWPLGARYYRGWGAKIGTISAAMSLPLHPRRLHQEPGQSGLCRGPPGRRPGGRRSRRADRPLRARDARRCRPAEGAGRRGPGQPARRRGVRADRRCGHGRGCRGGSPAAGIPVVTASIAWRAGS